VEKDKMVVIPEVQVEVAQLPQLLMLQQLQVPHLEEELERLQILQEVQWHMLEVVVVQVLLHLQEELVDLVVVEQVETQLEQRARQTLEAVVEALVKQQVLPVVKVSLL
jgi:hypothetical protein